MRRLYHFSSDCMNTKLFFNGNISRVADSIIADNNYNVSEFHGVVYNIDNSAFHRAYEKPLLPTYCTLVESRPN